MINSTYFWTNVFSLAVGTLTIRFSIIALSKRVKIENRTKELFSFIPVSILPAFIAPSVFFHNGQVGWALGKERFVLLIFATLVGAYTRSTLTTILFGLVALYFVTQFTA